MTNQFQIPPSEEYLDKNGKINPNWIIREFSKNGGKVTKIEGATNYFQAKELYSKSVSKENKKK